MKNAATLLIVAILAGCASSGNDEPAGRGGRGRFGGDGAGEDRPAAAAAGGIEIIPTSDWWHNDQIAGALNLSNDQIADLDKIRHDQSDTIERLRHDSLDAARNLRTTLEADRPTAEEILESGRRLRAVRAELIDRQVQLLSDERHVLTHQQWASLEDQLQRRAQNRNPYGRGDGGFPRGGRRPGRGPGF
jgi:Spy/CpxP family protein refolding chaperone